MRFLSALLVLSLFPSFSLSFSPQDPGANELARKCGSTVKWAANDTWQPPDGQPERTPGKDAPKIDRVELWNGAKAKAKEQSRLILWYVFRVAGVQMYRSPLPDGYMMQTMFSDPEIVELVNRRFVPVRLFADGALGAEVGIKALEFVEPGLVFCDADGKVVHKIDRIRTFSPDWFLSVLVAVLKKSGSDKVAGSAEELMLAGDYDGATAALEKAENPYLLACLKRRMHDAEGALAALDKAKAGDGLVETERGVILVRQGRFEEAEKVLEEAAKVKSARQAEAKYYLAAARRFLGQDADAAKAFASLVKDHADSPWGWRAAACINKSKDTTPDGGLVHAFEDLAFAPAFGDKLPADTNWTRGEKDLDDVVKHAVEFILRHQREDGCWNDTRYAYWPNPNILPNTRVAISSLCCAALLEWRDVDPKRIDKALEKGEKYILDEKNMLRKNNEESYADSYRLLYLARKHLNAKGEAGKAAAKKACAGPLTGLLNLQAKDGSWAHEYPNPWSTGVAIQSIYLTKKMGVGIPDEVLTKSAQLLQKNRSKEGGFPYEFGRGPSSSKDSMGRGPVCEAAMLIGGTGKIEQIEASLANWWEKYNEIAIVRRNDFHSNGELAGFFFYHDIFHSSEAATMLGQKARDEQMEKFLKLVLSLPEVDGSFVDSHEMGKTYGSAMALLTVKNCVRNKTPTKK